VQVVTQALGCRLAAVPVTPPMPRHFFAKNLINTDVDWKKRRPWLGIRRWR
jgi:hypothetical protein